MQANDPRALEVLNFWFTEHDRKAWFGKDPAFDAEIGRRFLPLHEEAAAGRLAGWKTSPYDVLALVLALDQFPRNLFRNSPRAFACDAMAIDAARHAIDSGHDQAPRPVERSFLYLPFEHSESLDDQWRSLALIAPLAAWPETADAFSWAVRHWEIIRSFGRFPHRNAILGRDSTAAEIDFLKEPRSRF